MSVKPPKTPPAQPRDVSLSEHVHQRLRRAICEGRYQPGQRIPESEVSKWLGVSRTPVREAFRRQIRRFILAAREAESERVNLVPVLPQKPAEKRASLRLGIDLVFFGHWDYGLLGEKFPVHSLYHLQDLQLLRMLHHLCRVLKCQDHIPK